MPNSRALTTTLLCILLLGLAYLSGVHIFPSARSSVDTTRPALSPESADRPAVLPRPTAETIASMSTTLKHLKIAPKEAHTATVIFLHVRLCCPTSWLR